MAGTVDVYTWEPNANSGKPLLCLHEKQVPFVHYCIGMGVHEHHEPAFLANGLKLAESTPATEYIDDAFAGPALRPAEPALRWRTRWILRVPA